MVSAMFLTRMCVLCYVIIIFHTTSHIIFNLLRQCLLVANVGDDCTNPYRLCAVNAYCGSLGTCQCLAGANLVGSVCVFPTGNSL